MQDSKKNDKGEPSGHTARTVLESDPINCRTIWSKKRYLVTFLIFLGFINLYQLRVNLSIGILAMTQNRTDPVTNIVHEPAFSWGSKERGIILSSFFYGYIFTQFLGGYLGTRFGGNYVFGIGIGGAAVVNLFGPLAANCGIQYLIASRVITGVFSGVAYSSSAAIFAKWAPPLERSRMVLFCYAGSSVGTIIAMYTCGLIAEYMSWEYTFYIYGISGCIWYVAWVIIVRSGPEKDKCMSQREVDYIQRSLRFSGNDNLNYPWKAFFTSKPVYAILASNFASNWGTFTMLTQLPAFFQDTLKNNLDKTGYISAIPYVALTILMPTAGAIADLLQIHGYLNTTQTRKYFNCISYILVVIFIMVSTIFAHKVWTVVFITLTIGLGAFAWVGFAVNSLDIAPQYAGVIFGLTNTVSIIPGIISPIITGFIVQHKALYEWRIVFGIMASVYVVSTIVYWFWASGELQEWAKNKDTVENPNPNPNTK